MPYKSKVDWDTARLIYETDCTRSPKQIGEQVGCSRQAVEKQAKKNDWVRATDENLKVAENMAVAQPVKGSLLGKRSPENIAQALNIIALSRNESLACQAIGIDGSTWIRWKKEDPDLARQCRAMRARKVVSWIETMDRSAERDWKAADRLLQIAEETKEQFGESRDSGPTIVLNIQRDEVVIEQG